MSKLTTIQFTIKGTAPLLMHNEQLANRFHPLTKRLAEIAGKRKKTEDDALAMQRIEWEGGLYWNQDVGPFIPGANLKRCLQEAAKSDKGGKSIIRALAPLDAEVPLVYKGPRDIEGMWDTGEYVDIRSVNVANRKIMRTRPRFANWGIQTAMYVNTTLVDLDDLARWFELAGMSEGLGDYRPTFGRFTGTMEEIDAGKVRKAA